MRRLLLPALVLALLVGTFAGVASARFAESGSAQVDQRDAAPFRAPVALPAADAAQPGAWTFRSSDAIGRDMERAAGGAAAEPAGTAGAGATVTITAVVLPVVFIVVDESGDVTELVTNTEERDARAVVYLVRAGAPEGDSVTLDARIWAQARAALAEAGSGTGTIWTS